MTKIKICGLSSERDIEAANVCRPDFVGFVFTKKSRRYVSPSRAADLKSLLMTGILAVGVFVNEDVTKIAHLLEDGVIDLAQLHGGEDEGYIKSLRGLTLKPLIKAFRIDGVNDIEAAKASSADYVLLDSGNGGTGKAFDWRLSEKLKRPYFLAGGLNPGNVSEAVARLHPYAVDVSSGIETDGVKDAGKMRDFVDIARGYQGKE